MANSLSLIYVPLAAIIFSGQPWSDQIKFLHTNTRQVSLNPPSQQVVHFMSRMILIVKGSPSTSAAVVDISGATA